ncbi:MAG: hypothetical protein RL141_311 [Candidatus Parcubacteria bacterium]
MRFLREWAIRQSTFFWNGLLATLRNSPRVAELKQSSRRQKTIPEECALTNSPAFTLPELLVSIAILAIISLSVAGGIVKTQYAEELQSSARVVTGAMRGLQARALAASSVRTCLVGSAQAVCELSSTGCTGACSGTTPPFSVGAVFAVNATSVRSFAEVEPTLNNRRVDATESLAGIGLMDAHGGAGYVRVTSLVTNQGSVANATVTFERQSGAMRIDACATPAPLTPACGGSGEPVTLAVVLSHTRTGAIRTIRLNATTGKISFE